MFKRAAMRFLLGIAVAISALLQLSSAPGAQGPKPSPVAPQATSQPKTAATNPSAHELTATDLSAFLERLVPMQL